MRMVFAAHEQGTLISDLKVDDRDGKLAQNGPRFLVGWRQEWIFAMRHLLFRFVLFVCLTVASSAYLAVPYLAP